MAGTTHRLVIVGKETGIETIRKPASWYVPPKKSHAENADSADNADDEDHESSTSRVNSAEEAAERVEDAAS